jgi:ParB family transcriptional regulator, chromosome partitioning protein
MAKKGGLGRGLGEIFDEITTAYESELPTENEMEEIPLVEIKLNPHQPRKVFNEAHLKELSASIKRHGLLQPIVVTRDMDEYILIAGERRLRASKLANISHIKAIITDVDPSRFHELALIENIQRENLNPIELAHSFSALLNEHDLTHEELSQQVQKSRTQITNTLRLLTLSTFAQDALSEGKISQGHAKVLIGLEAKEQELMINSIVGQNLSVREVEQMAKNYKSGEPMVNKPKKSEAKLDIKHLKDQLKAKGIESKVSSKSLTVMFESQEDVDEFSKLFNL